MTPGRPLKVIVSVGDVYGQWTVLEATSSSSYFVCQCTCGTIKKLDKFSLKNGQSKSCGCLRANINSLTAGEAALNRKFGECKLKAKERNYSFYLTFEQFKTLVQNVCYYCGDAPRYYNPYTKRDKTPLVLKTRKISLFKIERATIFIHGIDRVNNEIGYVIDNCVTSCEDCNMAKRSRSSQNFIDQAYRIVAHQESLKQKKVA